MRGDRPLALQLEQVRGLFTPHARGSTVAGAGDHRSDGVYPACAGIDLWFAWQSPYPICLPRMRGDRPPEGGETAFYAEFTPHARGSTRKMDTYRIQASVYPACAGIDLATLVDSGYGACLPRMRGDRPLPGQEG